MYVSEQFIRMKLKEDKINVYKSGKASTLQDVADGKIPTKWTSNEGIKYLMGIKDD